MGAHSVEWQGRAVGRASRTGRPDRGVSTEWCGVTDGLVRVSDIVPGLIGASPLLAYVLASAVGPGEGPI